MKLSEYASDFIDFYSQHSNRMDDHWAEFIKIQSEWLLNRLKILFPQDKAFSVIDLGCGTGEILQQIADHFPNAILHGVDGTPEMIRKASQKLKGRASFTQADLNNYHFIDRYNVIISTTVLHHLPSPMDHIAQFHLGLKQDGHVFLSEMAINTWPLRFANMWWIISQKSHKQTWGENDFRHLIDTCQFHIENAAILKPDNFWRLQIYHLKS